MVCQYCDKEHYTMKQLLQDMRKQTKATKIINALCDQRWGYKKVSIADLRLWCDTMKPLTQEQTTQVNIITESFYHQ